MPQVFTHGWVQNKNRLWSQERLKSKACQWAFQLDSDLEIPGVISEFLSVSLRAPAMPSSLPWCFGEEVRTAWSFAKEGSGKQKLTAVTLRGKKLLHKRKEKPKSLGEKWSHSFNYNYYQVWVELWAKVSTRQMFLQFTFHNKCCTCENILMTSWLFISLPILEDFPGQERAPCNILPVASFILLGLMENIKLADAIIA